MNKIIDSAAALLLDTLDSLDTPAFLVDNKNRVLSCNNSAGRALQYSADDIEGQHVQDFILMPRINGKDFPFDKFPPAPSTSLRGHIDTGAYESSCRRKDGSTFIAQVSIMTLPKDEQKLLVIRDISDQRKLQQKASQRTKELSIFNTLAKILTGHIPTDMIMQETTDMLADIMEAEQSWIYLIDDKTGELCLKSRAGMSGDDTNPGEALSRKVLASGRPLLVENASKDPRITRKNMISRAWPECPYPQKGLSWVFLALQAAALPILRPWTYNCLAPSAARLGWR